MKTPHTTTDDDARKLVEQFQHKVFNTALGFVHCREDAEDIAQEVFIHIFDALERFRGEAQVSTWVYRITVNTSLEFLRKKKRKKRFHFVQSLIGTGSDEAANIRDETYHPGLVAENKERAAILFKAIETLPEQQRIAFVLRNVEGLSYEEIGTVMNTGLTAVESLLHRAKKNLQKRLASYYAQTLADNT